MKHVFRFLGARRPDGVWTLSSDDATHAKKVVRLARGDVCEVADGAGQWCRGSVAADSLHFEIIPDQEFNEPPPSSPFILAMGALRFRVLDDVLPALVELGTDALHLFLQPGTESDRLNDKTMVRWQRIVAEATKQSKRAYLMSVVTHVSIQALIGTIPAGGTRLVLAVDAKASLAAVKLEGPIVLVAGSEQGLSDGELETLQTAGFCGTRLARPVLRATTAALAGAAVVAARRL